MTEDGAGERVVITAAGSPDVLDRTHDELAALWSRNPHIAEADRLRFETGLIEVLGNVVEHALGLDGATGDGSGARQLTVVLTVSSTVLEAVVEDDGRPVEVDMSAVTMPGADAESGRGLAIAMATLDVLEHTRVGGRNRWTLACRL